MAIPSPYHLVHPLLRVLAARGGEMLAADAREEVANLLNLSPEERLQHIPSGRFLKYSTRVGWAMHIAKKAKLAESAGYGHWQLTGDGRAVLERNPSGFSDEMIRQLRASNTADGAGKSSYTANGERESSSGGSDGSEDQLSPQERVAAAVGELRDKVSIELLERISKQSATSFEKLVLDVLHKIIGRGNAEDDIQHTGRSGDGGIDGIISLDKLGLDKVYVQAKRWQAPVGRPEIQRFMGALQTNRATRGVFITNARFTPDAIDAAKLAHVQLVLIDGSKLTTLMIDHGVAVKHETALIPAIHESFFIEDN